MIMGILQRIEEGWYQENKYFNFIFFSSAIPNLLLVEPKQKETATITYLDNSASLDLLVLFFNTESHHPKETVIPENSFLKVSQYLKVIL